MELSASTQILYSMVLVFALSFVYNRRQHPHPLMTVPRVGNLTTPLSRCLAGFQILVYGRAMLEESYHKVFQKVPASNLMADCEI